MDQPKISSYRGHSITTRCGVELLTEFNRFSASFSVSPQTTGDSAWQAFPDDTFPTQTAAVSNAHVAAMKSIDFDMAHGR